MTRGEIEELGRRHFAVGAGPLPPPPRPPGRDAHHSRGIDARTGADDLAGELVRLLARIATQAGGARVPPAADAEGALAELERLTAPPAPHRPRAKSAAEIEEEREYQRLWAIATAPLPRPPGPCKELRFPHLARAQAMLSEARAAAERSRRRDAARHGYVGRGGRAGWQNLRGAGATIARQGWARSTRNRNNVGDFRGRSTRGAKDRRGA